MKLGLAGFHLPFFFGALRWLLQKQDRQNPKPQTYDPEIQKPDPIRVETRSRAPSDQHVSESHDYLRIVCGSYIRNLEGLVAIASKVQNLCSPRTSVRKSKVSCSIVLEDRM